MEDKCICCGEIIPEGRQVCPQCENKQATRKENKMKYSAVLVFGKNGKNTKTVSCDSGLSDVVDYAVNQANKEDMRTRAILVFDENKEIVKTLVPRIVFISAESDN